MEYAMLFSSVLARNFCMAILYLKFLSCTIKYSVQNYKNFFEIKRLQKINILSHHINPFVTNQYTLKL